MSEPVRRRVAVVGRDTDRLTAAVAEVLARDHDVDSIPAGVGTGEGRGFDLVVAPARAVLGRACGARHGLLTVEAADASLAPDRDEDDPPIGSKAVVVLGRGTGSADATGVRWFAGDAELFFSGPIGEPREVELRILRSLPPGVDAVPLRVEVGGHLAVTAMLRAARPGDPAELTVSVPVEGWGPLHPVRLRVVSGRDADVAVAVAYADVPRPLDRAARRLALTPPPWWTTWDGVLAGSYVAARWLAHAWQVPATVLPPPVALPDSGTAATVPAHIDLTGTAAVSVDVPAVDPARAERAIVVPGPFGGASYKQAELIGVYQVLRERGHVEGWELHLVGPVLPDGDKAVERARRRAAEVPGVTFHLDPSPAEEAELLARSAIAWGAVGIGEDTVAEPELTDPTPDPVVRAMASGTVPVVVRGAATDGIVVHRENGLVVPSLALLLAGTEELVADAELRARLGRAAAVTAVEVGPLGFAAELRATVADMFA